MIDPHGMHIGNALRIITACNAVLDGVATQEHIADITSLVRMVHVPELRTDEQRTAFIERVRSGALLPEDRHALLNIVHTERAQIRIAQHKQEHDRMLGVRY